jgi:hypothetical protein
MNLRIDLVVLALLGLFLFDSCSLINIGSGDPVVLTCDDFTDDIKLEKKGDRAVDYLIDCLVEVDDIDIGISENVVIEFTEGSGIIMNGDGILTIVSLIADEPITLRGAERKAGFWKGIHLNGNHTINRLTNVIISDAGDPNDDRFKGAITVKTNGWIRSTKISNVSGNGIYVHDYGKIRDALVNIDIRNCSDYPVSLPVSEWDEFYEVIPPDASLYGNVYIENCIPNKIEVRGSNQVDLQKFSGDIIDINYPYEVKGDVIIELSSRFNLYPGAEVEMGENARIYVYGSFSSKGESGNPVIMRGVLDENGYWGGIYIDRPNAVTANKIEYFHILNGGGGSFENANITLKSGKYIVENCRISKSASCGLRYFANEVTLNESGNIFADNSGGGLCMN